MKYIKKILLWAIGIPLYAFLIIPGVIIFLLVIFVLCAPFGIWKVAKLRIAFWRGGHRVRKFVLVYRKGSAWEHFANRELVDKHMLLVNSTDKSYVPLLRAADLSSVQEDLIEYEGYCVIIKSYPLWVFLSPVEFRMFHSSERKLKAFIGE